MMEKIRLGFTSLLVISMSLLVGFFAYEKLTSTDDKMLENIFLQTMHITLIIATILNVLHFRKTKQAKYAFLTALPLLLYLLSFIGHFFDFRFSPFYLLLFDFYVLFWFYFLLIRRKG